MSKAFQLPTDFNRVWMVQHTVLTTGSSAVQACLVHSEYPLSFINPVLVCGVAGTNDPAAVAIEIGTIADADAYFEFSIPVDPAAGSIIYPKVGGPGALVLEVPANTPAMLTLTQLANGPLVTFVSLVGYATQNTA